MVLRYASMVLTRSVLLTTLLLAGYGRPLVAQPGRSSARSATDSLRQQRLPDTSGMAVADSALSVFNVKRAPWYIRTMPFSIYTGAGKPTDRIAQTIEIGKSFNIVDLGVALGRSSLRPDTTLFVEGRVTMDVANYGVFANEMTIGAGKLFDTRGSLMLELSYTIFAQLAPRFGLGLTTGYFDFSNEITDSSKTYYGIYLRYGVQRTDTGGTAGHWPGSGASGAIWAGGARSRPLKAIT